MGAPEEPPVPALDTMVEQMQVNGAPVEATLTASAEGAGGWLRWREVGGARREGRLSVDGDLLGLERHGKNIRLRAFVEVEVKVGGAVFGCGGVKDADGDGGGRVMKDFTLEAQTEEAAEAWAKAIQQSLDSLGRPKRLLILLNPFGGTKTAPRIFRNEVEPLLDAAGVDYVVQETKYRFHAQEIANTLDLMEYDGIVCVSGDGILSEVVNGLLKRGDWHIAIKMPLGIIPAGTGNGMAKSLLDSVGQICSASNAIFSVIRGHKQPLDVSSLKQGNTFFFSVLMLSWGYIADVDIESEKYRWMGSMRIDFYALLRIINLRKYHGRVYFVPAPGYEGYGEAAQQGIRDANTNVNALCEENGVPFQHCGYQGPTVCFNDSQWRCIEGPFVSAWLHNVPWASNDTMAAPEAKFSDGFVDVVLVKDCPKSALARLLSKANDGSHVKSPYVIYLKVRAFRLEPGQRVNDDSKGGIIDSDGEVIARGKGTYRCREKDIMMYGPPVEMTVDKGLATLFSPR